MSRKKILWLCSWYPNKMEPFNGDFIQRHAAAAAQYHDIHILHVAGDASGRTSRKEEVLNQSPGLTEQLIYYPMSPTLTGRLIAHYTWLKICRKAIRDYMARNGRPDLVHIHIPYKAGLLGIWMKKKFGINYIVTEHWTIYQPQNLLPYEQQKAFLRSVIRRTVTNSLRLLPVSSDLGSLINKKVAQKGFTVVENVANEKYFHYPGVTGPGPVFRFIHVSNMTYQKNAEGIVTCFREYHTMNPEAELVIAGSVSSGMKTLISETGLLDKNIFLRGEISYMDVAVELQQANALVMFSRFENSPCSIIEALCCGLPVIATRVGGIPELINESNGLLIEQGDNHALLAAFESMVKTYAAFDRKIIAEQAAGRFSYPVIGKKFDAIYQEMIPVPV